MGKKKLTIIQELAMLLRSESCPACSEWKQADKAFCLRCYNRLPKHYHNGLWLPMWKGYREAFEDALIWLQNE